MALTEARKKANKKWDEANKEKKKYYAKKSTAKSYVKIATLEDLEELKKLILERKQEL